MRLCHAASAEPVPCAGGRRRFSPQDRAAGGSTNHAGACVTLAPLDSRLSATEQWLDWHTDCSTTRFLLTPPSRGDQPSREWNLNKALEFDLGKNPLAPNWTVIVRLSGVVRGHIHPVPDRRTFRYVRCVDDGVEEDGDLVALLRRVERAP